MVGVTPYVDLHATLARPTKASVKKLVAACPAQHFQSEAHAINAWRRAYTSVLTGSIRYRDRLCAAGLCQSDACPFPECQGARCTADHWHYECVGNPCVKKYHAKKEAILKKIQSQAHQGIQRKRRVERMLELPCFRLCAICPQDPSDGDYISARSDSAQDSLQCRSDLAQTRGSRDAGERAL